MNTAILGVWVCECEDWLVSQGVPRDMAESLMRYVRNGAIAAEAEARNEAQFLLDFDRLGSDALGVLHGKSGQAMRKRRTAILRKKQPPVAVSVAR
jgi:hypothetical protein